MKRTAGADVPAVCFLRETLKMGRGLFVSVKAVLDTPILTDDGLLTEESETTLT
jgi:hypothetical protein